MMRLMQSSTSELRGLRYWVLGTEILIYLDGWMPYIIVLYKIMLKND